MMRHLPNFIHVQEYRVMVEYRGMHRMRICWGQKGHVGVACNTPRCTCCSVFGHIPEGCTTPCHCLGRGHATADCMKPRFYSAIAHGDGPRVASIEKAPAALTVTCTVALLQPLAEAVPIPELNNTTYSTQGRTGVCTSLCSSRACLTLKGSSNSVPSLHMPR